MEKRKKGKDGRAKSALTRLVSWLADWLGLIDYYKAQGRNEVIAEIAVIDRKLAGMCMDNDLELTPCCAIERLKFVLMGESEIGDILETIRREQQNYREAS